jgi:hypothetical protein
MLLALKEEPRTLRIVERSHKTRPAVRGGTARRSFEVHTLALS